MSEKGIIMTSTETDPGRVQISLYERHDPGEPGAIMRHELTLFEMAHLHQLLVKALHFHISNMVP